MPKITARVSVRGTDIKEMMTAAREQMADLGDVKWRIIEMELWGQDDLASKQGMVKMWSASMTMEANVPD